MGRKCLLSKLLTVNALLRGQCAIRGANGELSFRDGLWANSRGVCAQELASLSHKQSGCRNLRDWECSRRFPKSRWRVDGN